MLDQKTIIENAIVIYIIISLCVSDDDDGVYSRIIHELCRVGKAELVKQSW